MVAGYGEIAEIEEFLGCGGPQSPIFKDTPLRGRFDLAALRGSATTQIDSPHLRGEGCLIAQLHRLWTLVTSSRGNFLGK